MFGDRQHRRKVYYLAECSKIPIWRLGATLAVRKKTYDAFIEYQEKRTLDKPAEEEAKRAREKAEAEERGAIAKRGQ
ncbi:hypothetical protein [Bradyrhizobium genosp. A]|uniref:hypothetical protein n=1 Tax=Bradyrhizobium genosp. A TaxID=83626 RepID=UPI003CE8556E